MERINRKFLAQLSLRAPKGRSNPVFRLLRRLRLLAMTRFRLRQQTLICVIISSLILSGVSGCAFSRKAKKDKDTWTKEDEKYAKHVRFISAADLKEDRWAVENYLIDVDDVIDISVWQIEELHKEVTVRPDGKISFPLIGDVQAKSKTVDGLRGDIAEKIKLYIKVPQVSVTIKDFGGKKAVVLGRVENPSVIRFTSPIRVSEAIALAGNFITDTTDRPADIGSVYIIRDLQGDEPVIIVSDVGKILYQADLREDILIKQGDIIYVQASLLGNILDFMKNTFTEVVKYAETYYGVPLWRRWVFESVEKGTKWRYKTGFK